MLRILTLQPHRFSYLAVARVVDGILPTCFQYKCDAVCAHLPGLSDQCPLATIRKMKISGGKMLTPNSSPGTLFGSMGLFMAVTLWGVSEWETFNKTMAKDIQHPVRHNFLPKDMGCKYLLCTSLQDAQKIPWNWRNFSTLMTILQCFTFGAQENKRICVGCLGLFFTTGIAIIFPTIHFDWPFGKNNLQHQLRTIFALNTGPWASLWKKTANNSPWATVWNVPVVQMVDMRKWVHQLQHHFKAFKVVYP